MADTSKSIMDAINEATVAAGGQPCGGSIVDCLRNYYLVVNGTVPAELMGGNANISDLAKGVIAKEDSGNDDSGNDDSGNDDSGNDDSGNDDSGNDDSGNDDSGNGNDNGNS